MIKKRYEKIIDLNSPRFDLFNWLGDMFKRYEYYKYSPAIVMGDKTFETFKSVIKGIELNAISGTRTYTFEEYAIPESWISIDRLAHPYYISIRWEEVPKRKINRDSIKIPDGYRIQHVFYDEFVGLDRGHGFQKVPHIDHVKFNGPATIVFWKDGTKTVVKHDGKGRKDKRLAVLYAFIRKIYGEGKPYHNILNEIEEAVK